MSQSVRAPSRQGLLLRAMASNAFLLSLAYLLLGVALEALRRVLGVAWAARLLLAMDALPARALELVGLLGPLRERYLDGQLAEWQLRAAFAGAALGVIFATALAVGLLMGALLSLARRRAPR